MSTKIEWTDETWPVVTGCTPCSIGCTNCYAARMAATRLKHHPRYEGLATISNGKAKWTGEVRLNHDVLEQPLRWRKPRRVFVASMGDLFHEDVPFVFVRRIFRKIAEAPWHTYQILTKRPLRMSLFFEWYQDFCDRLDIYPHKDMSERFPNVHLGVSVENQAAADERREYLERCPAAVKFVSYEPALGPIDWTGWEFVSQIISGGESGPGARPSHPDWHRATRDFCQENEIAYFMKQWGAWLPFSDWPHDYHGWTRAYSWEPSYDGRPDMVHVGKKAAGHLLDGREWQEFPVADGALT